MANRVVIEQAGGCEQLQIQSFASPVPEAAEVRIDVAAAGINFADVAVRQGLYASAKQLAGGFPITPGFEVAGTVAEVGRDVTGLEVGQRVMAATLFGGYSSEAAVTAQHVRPIPDEMSFSEAAGVPAVFLTAYYATQHLARVHPGSTALIHSGAGGVGLALTQTLKAEDCTVVGVVGSPAKVNTALEYGADAVIDKSTQDLWVEAEKLRPDGYDQIFDPNGPETLGQSNQHLAIGGLLFIYGFQTMLTKNRDRQNPLVLAKRYIQMRRSYPDIRLSVQENRSYMCFNISFLFDKADIFDKGFDYIIDNLEDGTFRPLPVTEYPFEDVAQAHQDIESGKTTGKLVLTF